MVHRGCLKITPAVTLNLFQGLNPAIDAETRDAETRDAETRDAETSSA
jgi:hypothetical protein